MSTPATLPANFFESKTGQANPPQTLPGNFDFQKGSAPAPLTTVERGASQATGLRASDPKGAALDKMQSLGLGQGAKAAGVAASLEGGKGIYGLIGRAFQPTSTMVPVASKILDAQGNPLMQEVEQLGASQAAKAAGLGKEAVKKIIGWIGKNPVPSYIIYKTLEEVGIAPHKAMKILHLASE